MSYMTETYSLMVDLRFFWETLPRPQSDPWILFESGHREVKINCDRYRTPETNRTPENACLED